MSITLLDVSVMLMLVALILMQLTNVITSMILRFLLMATLLLYHNVKDVIDGTKPTKPTIQTGKEMHLFIVHNKIFSVL